MFDKVEELAPLVGAKEGLTYSGMVDRALNHVLMRSLNTSITALLPVASLLFLGSFVLGATTLEEFALALLIGLFAGAYSSIFIASPMLAWMKEKEPRYRAIREKIESRQGSAPAPTGGTPAKSAVPAGSRGKDVGPTAAASTTITIDGDGEVGWSTGTPALRWRRRAGRRPTDDDGGARHPPRPRKKGKKR